MLLRQFIDLVLRSPACCGFLWSSGCTRPWVPSQVLGLMLTVLGGLTGLAEWRSVPVEHCSDAHGLVLRAAAGWSLVFSGDTRPCAALAAAGRGATLLVHEATFEPALLAQVWESCPVLSSHKSCFALSRNYFYFGQCTFVSCCRLSRQCAPATGDAVLVRGRGSWLR